MLGRIRRNPRLLDFETLTEKQKELATTAWVWGIKPDSMLARYTVSLYDKDVKIKVKSTKLLNLTQKVFFDLEKFIDDQKDKLEYTNIFELYKRINKMPNDVQNLCYEYANNNVLRWYKFAEYADKVKANYDAYICDYEKSMVVDKEVGFPDTTSYVDTEHKESDMGWIWRRKDGKDRFAFDSFAEKEWAAKLKKLALQHYVMNLEMSGTDEDNEFFLWGKNFPVNSEIKYEYYANGIHASYPDFVLKDKYGRIHIFEVKSVNIAAGSNIDKAVYEEKVQGLHNLYLACSKKLPDYRFYLPIMKDDEWRIRRFWGGIFNEISFTEFRESLKTE